jgi:hypothetical protein
LNGFGKVKTELCPQKVLREVSSETAESWRLGGWKAKGKHKGGSWRLEAGKLGGKRNGSLRLRLEARRPGSWDAKGKDKGDRINPPEIWRVNRPALRVPGAEVKQVDL